MYVCVCITDSVLYIWQGSSLRNVHEKGKFFRQSNYLNKLHHYCYCLCVWHSNLFSTILRAYFWENRVAVRPLPSCFDAK